MKLITMVKLDDALPHERPWVVVEVVVSARVVGTIQRASAGTFKTKREATEHVKEMKERAEQERVARLPRCGQPDTGFEAAGGTCGREAGHVGVHTGGGLQWSRRSDDACKPETKL